MSRRGTLLFAAMCVIWGIPYLLIRVSVREVTPATLVFLRTAIGAAILVPIAWQRRQLRPLLPHWRVLVVYTAVELGIPWVLLSDAETRLPSSLAGLLVAAVPLVGAVIAWAQHSDERPDLRRVVGLVVGIIGVGAVLGLDLGDGNLRALGEMCIVVIGYAVGPMIIARGLAGLSSLGVVAASLLIAAVAYAPVALIQHPARVPGADVLFSVAALSTICTAVAFLVFFALIAEVGPIRATVITYINPAIAVLLGVVLLGEPLRAGTIVGFVLILSGSYLATRRTAAAPTPIPEASAAALAESGTEI